MGVALVLLSLSILIVLGLAFFGYSHLRRSTKRRKLRFAKPPEGWPDIPVTSLSVFQPRGRINQVMPRRPHPRIRRFQSYDRTQSFVVDLVGQAAPRVPKIALQLSKDDGPDWTDVLLDGSIVAHVQTTALTEGRPAH